MKSKLSSKLQTYAQDMIEYLREERPFMGLADVFHGISKEKGFWETITSEEFAALKITVMLHERYGCNSFRDFDHYVPEEHQREWLLREGFIEERFGHFFISEKGMQFADQYKTFNELFGIDQYILNEKSRALSLIHSELSEVLEGLRSKGTNTSPQLSEKLDGFSAEAEELADVQIRLLDYCARFNIDLDAAVSAKVEYNAQRSYKHGKKF